MSNGPLYVREECGVYRVAKDVEVFEAARDRSAACYLRKGECTAPEHTVKHLKHFFAGKDREEFVVIHLDARHHVIDLEVASTGSLTSCSVYAREIAKSALARSSAYVIFGHNHPSGACEPSSADRSLTTRLKEVLGMLDVRVLDHLVIGDDSHVSFAERGWL